MANQDISEIIYTTMSLLFLLLGVVLLVSILMSAINPYEQIAFANVEKLRAQMDQACYNPGTDISMSFELPQNTPILTSAMTAIPRWIIKTNGDPNYVLYYEAFPAGDATGWEVYQDMQNRLITQVDTAGKNSQEVGDYVLNQVIPNWNSRVADPTVEMKSKNLEGVIVNNIILGEARSDYYLGEQAPGKPTVDVGLDYNDNFGLYGEWKDKDENGVPLKGDNKYGFKNYLSMTSFEKAAIKYAPCGVNSLCMKTRSGVYSFPLKQCGNIKYIEMKYDDRSRGKFYTILGVAFIAAGTVALAGGATIAIGSLIPAGAVAVAPGVYAYGGATILGSGGYVTGVVGSSGLLSTVGGAISTAAGWFGSGVLRLLSLSWGGSKILTLGGLGYATAKVAEVLGGVFLSYKIQDFNVESPCAISGMKIKMVDCQNLECERFISYPIYEYETDGKLKDAGKTHYACVEKIGTDIDTAGRPRGEVFTPQDKCLQIVVEDRKPEEFCWTPDPYKEGFWDSDTRKVAKALGFLPINQNTAYIEGSASSTILKYYPPESFKEWEEAFRRRVMWGWPL